MMRKLARNDALLRDKQLVAELEEVKTQIIEWANKNSLWYDAGFKIPFEHRNEAPRQSEVLYLWAEGPLTHVFSPDHEDWDRLDEEFRTILEGMGWVCELEDHVTLNLTPEDESKQLDFLRLQRWQWIQKLSERRLFDLHVEIFEHFANDHDALQSLHWRKLEEFMDGLCQPKQFARIAAAT